MEEFTKNKETDFRMDIEQFQLISNYCLYVYLKRKKKEIIEDTENRRHRNTARRN